MNCLLSVEFFPVLRERLVFPAFQSTLPVLPVYFSNFNLITSNRVLIHRSFKGSYPFKAFQHHLCPKEQDIYTKHYRRTLIAIDLSFLYACILGFYKLFIKQFCYLLKIQHYIITRLILIIRISLSRLKREKGRRINRFFFHGQKCESEENRGPLTPPDCVLTSSQMNTGSHILMYIRVVKNRGSWTPTLESAVSISSLVTELTWGNGVLDRSYLPLQPHQLCDSGIIINCF